MKLSTSSLCLCAALLLCAATASKVSAVTILETYYNFNDSNLISDLPGAQTTTITVNNLGTTFSNGTTANQPTVDVTGAGFALRLTDANNGGGNAKTFQFTVNTTGFAPQSLSYATQASNTSFTQTLSYSVNGGTTFTLIGTYSPQLAWTTKSFNLSGITQIDNQTGVIFQIALTQSGGQRNEWNDFDNIQLTADAIVPEPATWIGGAVAAAAAIGCKQRRRKVVL